MLTFVLVAVPLTGCEEYESFEYTTSEQGQYVASGKTDYKILKSHYFLAIENSSYDVTEYYIAVEYKHNNRYGPSYTTYTDIFGNQTVFDSGSKGNRQMLFAIN